MLQIVYLQTKQLGVVLYVLTNTRLIKIEINDHTNSSSFFLNTITSIERKIINKESISIDIMFQNSSLGLSYPIKNKKITSFFQNIEQLKSDQK